MMENTDHNDVKGHLQRIRRKPVTFYKNTMDLVSLHVRWLISYQI